MLAHRAKKFNGAQNVFYAPAIGTVPFLRVRFHSSGIDLKVFHLFAIPDVTSLSVFEVGKSAVTLTLGHFVRNQAQIKMVRCFSKIRCKRIDVSRCDAYNYHIEFYRFEVSIWITIWKTQRYSRR